MKKAGILMIIFDANRIGKKIAAARKEKNMTQNDLADQLGVSYQAVSNWERSRSLPDIDKYADLARILDLDLDDLLNSQNAQHTIQIIQDDDAPLDADTLAEAAPVMKPAQVDERVDDADLSAVHLKDIAPFLSNAMVFKQLMKHRDDPDFLKLAREMAPFLADEDLAKIVDKYVVPGLPATMDTLKKFLPFLPDEKNDALLRQIWTNPQVDDRAKQKFYPFVSSSVLKELLAQTPDDTAAVVKAAPFLDDVDIQAYFQAWQQDTAKAAMLKKLAPFAASSTIADYVRYLLHTGADKAVWHPFLQFLDDDDLLSLGKD